MKGVIADSDDESDGGGYVVGVGGEDVQAMIKAQLSDSGADGLATSSTDPAFFHSVLMEQRMAAGHQTRVARQNMDLSEWNRHELESLPPTATSFAFQPSVQQPLPPLDSSFYPPTAPTNFMILPQTLSQVDPYEIPSSAEQHAAKAKLQRGTKKARHDQQSSGIIEADDAGSALATRSAKRRRTANCCKKDETLEMGGISSNTQQAVSGGDEKAETQVDVPTGSDHFVTIETNHLITSQKLEYQSVELPLSPTQQSMSVPQPITRDCPIESSLATNINTQRSINMAQRELSPAQSAPAEQTAIGKRKPGRPRKDATSMTASVEGSTLRKKPVKSAARVLEDSDGDEDDWLGPEHHADDGEVNEASPVSLADEIPVKAKPKAKGKRGRPKQTQEPKVVEHMLDNGEQVNLNGEAAVKTKKEKRGRPKKKKETEAEKAAGDDSKENNASVDTSVASTVKEGEVEEVKEIEDGNKLKANDNKEGEDTKTSTLELLVEDSTAKKEVAQDDHKPLAASNSNSNSNEKKTSKQLCVGGAGAGKPFYRVGLSRRTSIAPLLKVIRK